MIIKEFCQGTIEKIHVVIRESNYGSQLDKFDRLFEVATQDFPNLNRSDVKVVHYGGRHYAKTFWIEFEAEKAPDDYREISQLEYTL